ncbi:hypothetical protein C8J56DRAFT_863713 [Mycena floridula]|nr:hypothetical protein C8J56DRAFT_863713 [Mycena floridula]
MLQQAREHRRFEAFTGRFRTAVLNGGLEAFRAANQGQEWKVSLDFYSEICTVFGTPEFQNKALRTIKGFMPTDPLKSWGDFCTLCCVDTGRLQVELGCGHSYCDTCLQMFLLSAAGPKFSRLTCLAKSKADGQVVSCSFPIPLTTIRRLLLVTEQGDLWASSFVAYVRDHPDELRFCPTVSCQMVYRPGNDAILCPCCHSWICSSCDVTYHEGLSCKEYRLVAE